MAVIINDFEVVLNAPAKGEACADGADKAAPRPSTGASELSPLELSDMLRWQQQRLARLEAN